jgi:hypothetical protein
VLSAAIVLFAAASQGAAAAVPTGGDSFTPVTDLPSSHHYRSGLVVGLSLGVGLGGASGYMFNHGLFRNPSFYSNTDGVGFRIEGYPLVALGSRWQGLAAFAQFGLGTGDLVSKPPNLPEADGTQSFGAAGVFYEWSVGVMRSGAHIGIGPSLEYDAVWTQPFESHGLVGSLRLAFYSGQ